ncbi:MAG: hypothetical protein Q7U74_07205 [Saprospiraceae bacterium]|nr:hypothetical protein [Saprospiraceae bacterium]
MVDGPSIPVTTGGGLPLDVILPPGVVLEVATPLGTPLEVATPPGAPLEVATPPGAFLSVFEAPFCAPYTYPCDATFYKNGSQSDWGDDRYFELPVALGNSPVKFDRIALIAVNPCPVPVVVRIRLSAWSGIDLLIEWEESVTIPTGGKGIYYINLPILLSFIGSYSYYYKAEYFPSEPFITEEGEYLIGKILFLSPLPWVA